MEGEDKRIARKQALSPANRGCCSSAWSQGPTGGIVR